MFTGSFLLYKGQTLLCSGTSCNSSQPLALFSALLEGLTYNFFSNHIRVFFPDPSLSNYLLRTSKHPFLLLSHSLISILSRFLDSHDLHQVDFFRYSIKWAGLPGTATLDILKEWAQHFIFPLPPTPLLPPKACLICDLQTAYHNTIQTSNVWQSIILPDGQPLPFYMGALSNLNCGTSSAAIQLTIGHSFSDDYSKIFQKGTNDNVIRPCNYSEAPDLAPVSPHSPGHFN